MDPESISQAKLLADLFDDADKALADFERSRSSTDLAHFYDVVVQIDHTFRKLTESVGENSPKFAHLSHIGVHVNQNLDILKGLKSELDREIVIVQDFRAHHMYSGSKSVAMIMRELLSRFIAKD